MTSVGNGDVRARARAPASSPLADLERASSDDLCYHSNTMKRGGRTETLSISLSEGPLQLLRRRAKQAHRGNLSAAIAEAAELLRRDIALGELARELQKEHGPLTDEERASIAEELQGSRAPSRKKKKRAA